MRGGSVRFEGTAGATRVALVVPVVLPLVSPLGLVLGLLLGLSGTTGCVHDRVVVDGRLEPEALARVAERTEALRQLPFEDEVLAEGVTREEQQEVLGRYLDAYRTDLDRQTLVYQRMGLLPQGASLADSGGGAFRNAVAGFYLYETEPARLYVALDYDVVTRLQLELVGLLTGVDWAYELPLAHELVHALQDHHLDLGTYLSPVLEQSNEDLALVRRSVLESEAGLVAYAHFHGLTLDGWLERRLHRAAVLASYLPLLWLPDALLPRSQRFFVLLNLGHYLRGIDFVVGKLDEGGFPALDRAYRTGMPESTEQLLFPEEQRGQKGYDPPVRLVPLDETPPGLERYDRIASNVFGALQMQLLLDDEGLLSDLGERLAGGWGGDRYEVWARTLPSKEVHTVLVWRTIWDDERSARDFEAAYRRFLDEKYPERLEPLARSDEGAAYFVARGAGAGGVFSALPEVVVLARRGDRVLVVEGAPPERWREVADFAWARFDVEAPAPAMDIPPPAVDVGGDPEAVLALDDGRLPAPPRRSLGLPARFHLPRRTVALRTGVSVRTARIGESTFVDVDPDLELRWGIRDGLEYAAPFVLSFEERTPFGQTIVTGGLAAFGVRLLEGDLRARPGIALTHAFHLADIAAIAAQGRAVLDYFSAASERTFADASLALGVWLAPFDALTLGVGVARTERVDVGGPLLLGQPRRDLGGTWVIGSALTRGLSFRQPLVELRVLDILSLYATSSFALDADTLALVAHEHAAGLLFYF